jgi:hypothetical protein
LLEVEVAGWVGIGIGIGLGLGLGNKQNCEKTDLTGKQGNYANCMTIIYGDANKAQPTLSTAMLTNQNKVSLPVLFCFVFVFV